MMRVALALVFATATAHAEPEAFIAASGAQLFDEGRALIRAGKLDEACKRFEVSFTVERAVGTELNLADCKEREGELLEAWRLFEEAARLSESKGNKTRAAFARNRAAAIDARLSMIELRLAGPIARDMTVKIGDTAVTPARRIQHRMEPGTVTISATTPSGTSFIRTIHARSGTRVIEVPSFLDAPVVEARRRSRVWIAAGLALTSATAFVIGGKLATDADAIRRSIEGCTIDQGGTGACENAVYAMIAEQKVEGAETRDRASTGFIIGGVVVAAAAAVVWYTAPKERVVVTPTASASSVGVAVSARF